MHWKDLATLEQIDHLIQESRKKPQAILKHSTSCTISSIAKARLEDIDDNLGIDFHLLDLLRYRVVSNTVAEIFDVPHESPQLILVWNGEVVLDSSHLDITAQEILDNHPVS